MSSYPRSGEDMLRVAFPHKTDGVGGHLVTATSALGGAALLGLRLVCDPSMLYNGRRTMPESCRCSALPHGHPRTAPAARYSCLPAPR